MTVRLGVENLEYSDALATHLRESIERLQADAEAKEALLRDAHEDSLAVTAEDSGFDAPALLSRLKASMAELQEILAEKEGEVQALRLKAKFSRVEEVRVEAEAFIKESARLQVLLASSRESSSNPQVAAQLKALRAEGLALQEAHAREDSRCQSNRELAHKAWDAVRQGMLLLEHEADMLSQGIAAALARKPPKSQADADAGARRSSVAYTREACEKGLLEDEIAIVVQATVVGRQAQFSAGEEFKEQRRSLAEELARKKQEVSSLRRKARQLSARAKSLTKEVRVGERQLAADRKMFAGIEVSMSTAHSAANMKLDQSVAGATGDTRDLGQAKGKSISRSPNSHRTRLAAASNRTNATAGRLRAGEASITPLQYNNAPPQVRAGIRGPTTSQRQKTASGRTHQCSPASNDVASGQPRRGDQSKARFDHLMSKYPDRLPKEMTVLSEQQAGCLPST